MSNINKIEELLGKSADLLTHECKTISKDRLSLPGPDFTDRVWLNSDRNPRVLNNLSRLYNTGRLAGTGYVSILPVDQGIEHSAAASFAKNPDFRPRKHRQARHRRRL
jgi:class I fructose-bisphosphate aldolase